MKSGMFVSPKKLWKCVVRMEGGLPCVYVHPNHFALVMKLEQEPELLNKIKFALVRLVEDAPKVEHNKMYSKKLCAWLLQTYNVHLLEEELELVEAIIGKLQLVCEKHKLSNTVGVYIFPKPTKSK